MTVEYLIRKYNIFVEKKDGKATGRIGFYNATPEVKKEIMEKKQEILDFFRDEEEKRAEEAEAARKRKEKIDSIEGLKEIQGAIDDMEEWQYEFDKSFEDVGGLGVRKKPEYDFDEMKRKYPRAAAYIKANEWELSPNYIKSGIGRRAVDKILEGYDSSAAISDMEKEWSGYCKDHIWD